MQLSEMHSSHTPARLPFNQGIKMIFERRDCFCIVSPVQDLRVSFKQF